MATGIAGGLLSGYAAGKEAKETRNILRNLVPGTALKTTRIKPPRTTDTSPTTAPPGKGDESVGLQLGYRKGGRIKKTGVYRLHKGEVVVPARAARKITARKAGRR